MILRFNSLHARLVHDFISFESLPDSMWDPLDMKDQRIKNRGTLSFADYLGAIFPQIGTLSNSQRLQV